MTEAIKEDDLIRKYLTLIRKLACKYSRGCRCQADRDEIFSDALFGALHAIRTYDPERGMALESWVFRCVTQKVIDGIRLRTGHRKSIKHGTVPLAIDLSGDDLDISIDDRDEVEHLTWGLSLQSRDTLHLVYWEDLTFREAGERLGTSESGAFRRTRDIIFRLRKRAERSTK